MRPGRASRTAEHNALFRALESRQPVETRVLDDPLAAAFLPWPYVALVQAARLWPLRNLIIRGIDRRWPGPRTSLVARTRLIDDTIAPFLEGGGIGHVVILGAGFDTRAYRLPAVAAVPVYEVDHPDTQHRKRERLDRRGVADGHARFVPTDFLEATPADALAAAGFDATVPALVIWEGVSNYLDAEAVDATLRWCAGAAPGSNVVFTYIDRAVLDDPSGFAGAGRMFATIERGGEPMTFGLDPAEVTDYLSARGLELLSDVGAVDYRRTYFGAAAAGMVGHEFYRVAHARVDGS